MLLICSVSLFGQDTENTIERKGFVFGLGLSGGLIHLSESNTETIFDKTQGGLSLPNIKLGWMLNERLALLATFPGLIYEYDGVDRSFDAFLPTIQYWVKDRWWINGGIGLAVDGPALYEDLDNEDWNTGYALAASTGYEIVQKKKFAIDLQTRLQYARVGLDNDEHREAVLFTVGLGFNWY